MVRWRKIQKFNQMAQNQNLIRWRKTQKFSQAPVRGILGA
jgi:hypothetical protein